jgi:GntR family transcriptional regulator
MVNHRILRRQSSITSQILDILIENIRDGAYNKQEPLPSEYQLAEEFDVSRATIRSALDRLEALGLIYRRQGVGTFIRESSSISNPLNQFVNFFALIRDNGFEPGLEQLSAEFILPDAESARSLRLEPSQRVLEINKVFLADEVPIIFCRNLIPEWVLSEKFSEDEMYRPDFIEPEFLSFFEKQCQQPLKYFISEVCAELSPNIPFPPMFDYLDKVMPVLVVKEIGYNHKDVPILESIEFHPGNRMEFKLIRTA